MHAHFEKRFAYVSLPTSLPLDILYHSVVATPMTLCICFNFYMYLIIVPSYGVVSVSVSFYICVSLYLSVCLSHSVSL